MLEIKILQQDMVGEGGGEDEPLSPKFYNLKEGKRLQLVRWLSFYTNWPKRYVDIRIQFIRKIYGIESYVLNVVKRICIVMA